MASGHVNRIKRPNTWLHRPMLQNVKKALANPEPSTHGGTTQKLWPERVNPGRACGHESRSPVAVNSSRGLSGVICIAALA
jgi:hypothetical protein